MEGQQIEEETGLSATGHGDGGDMASGRICPLLPGANSWKRPLNEDDQEQPPKRPKLEPSHDLSVEDMDDMDQYVESALGEVSDLVSRFTSELEATNKTTTEGIETDQRPRTQPTLGRTDNFSLFAEPKKHAQIMGLPVLRNLAIQLIMLLCRLGGQYKFKLEECDGDFHITFSAIRQLFIDTRAMYADSAVVMAAPELGASLDGLEATVNLANIASACLVMLSTNIRDLFQVHQHFLEIFATNTSPMTTMVANMFVAVKTRLWNLGGDSPKAEGSWDHMREEIFGSDLESVLRSRHPGSGVLSAAEHHLLSATRARHDLLKGVSPGDEGQDRKAPQDNARCGSELEKCLGLFLHSISGSLIENAAACGIPLPHPSERGSPASEVKQEVDLDDIGSFLERTTAELVQNTLANRSMETPSLGGDETGQPVVGSPCEPATEDPKGIAGVDKSEYQELEALVAASTSLYVETTLKGLAPLTFPPAVSSSSEPGARPFLSHSASEPTTAKAAHNQFPASSSSNPAQSNPVARGDEALPPFQSCSTSVLYDRARQAAMSKSSAHTRREGIHSTRRPWSPEEEKALMAGLDAVKGPHWSQILSLYGASGGVSDILKDRTQVQLKDKARNLKLFFLKNNSEMPYYLKAVTGELKTRAPSQAARKEAEERAKMNTEENQAKIQGIMTLGGGLPSPPPPGRLIQAHGHNPSVGQQPPTPLNASISQGTVPTKIPHASPHHSNSAAMTQGKVEGTAGLTALSASPRMDLQSAIQPLPRPQAQLVPAQSLIPRPHHAQSTSTLEKATDDRPSQNDEGRSFSKLSALNH